MKRQGGRSAERSRVAAVRILGLIEEFLSGRDISATVTEEILEAILAEFRDTELEDELAGPLASYEPWGGDDPEHLYSAARLRPLLVWARRELSNWLGDIDNEPAGSE